jgi:hypothetical protein
MKLWRQIEQNILIFCLKNVSFVKQEIKQADSKDLPTIRSKMIKYKNDLLFSEIIFIINK